MVRFGTNSVDNERMDQNFTWSDRSLPIHTKIGIREFTIASGEDRHIVLVSAVSDVSGTSYCLKCDQKRGKNRCQCHIVLTLLENYMAHDMYSLTA